MRMQGNPSRLSERKCSAVRLSERSKSPRLGIWEKDCPVGSLHLLPEPGKIAKTSLQIKIRGIYLE